MKLNRARIIQIVAVLVVQAITLLLLQGFLSGLVVKSFMIAILTALSFSVAMSIFWFVFIEFFSWLPVILYPILTFVLTGVAVGIVGNFIPGVVIDGLGTALWITVTLSVVNAVLGMLLSLDEDATFDRNVTRRIVKKQGKALKTDAPGFLFLEIDGLGEQYLRRALVEGYMPTLKRWLDQGTHTITSWETDFTSQTGAMQTGILLGNNQNVPAYRWWDREQKRIITVGDPRDALALEGQLSSGRGLLSDGGASRINMFSGDATESLMTMSTVLNRQRGRGPGFYFYLFSPYILTRLISRFVIEIIKEWWQAWRQKCRKDKYRVSARNPAYAFLRGFIGPLAQDLATYTVISDVLRGVPAIYALYAGYDDLSHFAGIHSPETFEALHETDHYFSRIERALEDAPRPYYIVVLSDHGQSLGFTFENKYGVSLEALVDGLIQGSGEVYAAQGTDETWDKVNTILTESTQEDTRTARVLKGMLRSKTQENLVLVAGEEDQEEARQKKVIVMSSGCTGLVYFTAADERMTLEQIQLIEPDLVLGLVEHPGVGFVLIKSEEYGSMVMGKHGIHYLEDGKIEGENPLAPYGPNAARHLVRETSFLNCPDILVNTIYDPDTEELCGFENQVSHHGGLGGPQNHPFVIHPVELDIGQEPIVTAEGLHQLLRGWRDQAQGD